MVSLSEFLLSVCGPDDGSWIRVCAIDPTTGRVINKLCKSVGEVDEFRLTHTKQNLYFTPTRFADGGYKREQAQSTRCFRVDLDDADFPGLNPEEKRKALFDKLRAFPLPPTFEVETGGGIHAYWVCHGVLTGEAALKFAESVNYGLAKQLDADHCWDLPRLMRLPGTTNYPNAKKKKKGRVDVVVPLPCVVGPEYVEEQFRVYAEDPPREVVQNSIAAFAVEAPEKLTQALQRDIHLAERFAGDHYAQKEDGSIDRSGNDYALAKKLFELGFTKEEAGSSLLVFEYGKAPERGATYVSTLLNKIFPAPVEVRDNVGTVPDIVPIINQFANIWPDLQGAFVASLSTIASLCFSELPCCITLILMGPSSCGKSSVLNLFNDLDLDPAFFCRNDRSTVAAWVSMGKPMKGKKQEDMDLLAKARGKVMVSAELAPIFKSEKSELSHWFGVVASMLDGKGFKTHSGMIGDKEYKGDTTFNWLGASVPPEPEFHEIMANTGTRILFYYLDIAVPSRVERMKFDRWWDEGGKVLNTRLVADLKRWMTAFLKSNPFRSLRQKSIKIPEIIDERIHGYADLLCALRQVCDVVQEWGRDRLKVRERESPHRVSQQLRSLARGRALVFGRSEVTEDDLEIVENISLNTAKEERAKAMRFLVSSGGSFTLDNCVNHVFYGDRGEAIDRLRELSVLGVLDTWGRNTTGNEELCYTLGEDYKNVLNLYPHLDESFKRVSTASTHSTE